MLLVTCHLRQQCYVDLCGVWVVVSGHDVDDRSARGIQHSKQYSDELVTRLPIAHCASFEE